MHISAISETTQVIYDIISFATFRQQYLYVLLHLASCLAKHTSTHLFEKTFDKIGINYAQLLSNQ